MSERSDAETAEILEARAEFHEAYGAFMMHWAALEHSLGAWFTRLSGMPVRRSAAVFYSAKNFAGRADLVEAIMPHCEVEQEYLNLLRQCIKRARQYNSFRNSVAHGQSIYGAFPRGSEERFVLIPGGPPAYVRQENVIAVHQLQTAARNVGWLGHFMREADFHRRGTGRGAPPQKCLEQVLALPNRADQIPLDPSP